MVTIAIGGKGGVGKTTVAGLAVRRLIRRGATPVLAVDADPNTCLDEVLGVEATRSIGAVREEARELAGKGRTAGISKQEILEMRIAESLVEADDFDLIAMGRPEGPGCYCYANNVLKEALGRIAGSYPWTVIDNEAGLENLSRRIVPEVDLLVLVADPSRRGLETVRRMHDLAREMGVRYGKLAVAVNRLRRDRLPDGAEAVRAYTRADRLVGLPEDAELGDLAERGAALTALSDANPVWPAVDRVLDLVLENARMAG